MGCAASTIDNEEKVLVCRQRKRLMKKLLGFRGEFADAQLAYLRALRNTGVTPRQFTESETLELENTSYGLSFPLPPSPPPTLPPSPPPPPLLPPSPPPPPPFSPDLRKSETGHELADEEEEGAAEIDGGKDGSGATPPPPLPNSWNIWNPFESLELHSHPNGDNVVTQMGMKKKQQIQQAEEENWAETKSQFEEEDEQQEAGGNFQLEAVGGCDMKKPRRLKFKLGEVMDDNSSMSSFSGKDLENTRVTDCRIRKTLEGIIRELDDYFLKASGCEKEIAVIIDINSRDTVDPFRYEETRRKRSSSAKVFSALSWSWSSKSLQLGKDTTTSGTVEPCRPGAHCSTLEKLYTAEKKLYELVRNKEIAKVEHERKSALLQKQNGETYDLSKIEKTRLSLESLETEMQGLEDSITTTRTCVLNLINDELYPQLIALTSGLAHMWKTMLKCHQVQIHISQQLNHLPDYPSIDLSSEYKRQAVNDQLETEVTCWYNSFCKLINSQREYVKTLCTWIQHTDPLSNEDNQRSSLPVAARKLCKEWQLVFEKLPDKVTSEAIKSFLMAIKSVIHQQAEEYNLRRKCNKLEKRLEKELIQLDEMEIKLEGISVMEEEELSSTSLGSKHPLSIKQAKIEALRKQVDIEKAKYLNSVEVSKRMTLDNLKSSLPNVFQVLTALANVFSNGFESVHGQTGTDVSETSQDSDESQPLAEAPFPS